MRSTEYVNSEYLVHLGRSSQMAKAIADALEKKTFEFGHLAVSRYDYLRKESNRNFEY